MPLAGPASQSFFRRLLTLARIAMLGLSVLYPNEVEDVMMGCPKILECAAIGVPDPHSGELVKLFVVKKRQEFNRSRAPRVC